MRYIAGALLVFAWLITTNKIVDIKQASDGTLTPTYQKYCTTDKPLVANAKGQYIIAAPKPLILPVATSILEQVTVCP